MSLSTLVDRFEIVNGPEDGTEYPITRTPVDVGMDPQCAVNVRLDPKMASKHAHVTVVAEGYRVRALGTGKVWVNGKRTGTFRSRIVRNGGVLRTGVTELCLVTAADGLASRSRGLATESDLAWALNFLTRRFSLVFRVLWRSLRYLSGGWIRKVVIVVGFYALLAFFFPGFHDWTMYYLNTARWWFMNTLRFFL